MFRIYMCNRAAGVPEPDLIVGAPGSLGTAYGEGKPRHCAPSEGARSNAHCVSRSLELVLREPQGLDHDGRVRDLLVLATELSALWVPGAAQESLVAYGFRCAQRRKPRPRGGRRVPTDSFGRPRKPIIGFDERGPPGNPREPSRTRGGPGKGQQ